MSKIEKLLEALKAIRVKASDSAPSAIGFSYNDFKKIEDLAANAIRAVRKEGVHL